MLGTLAVVQDGWQLPSLPGGQRAVLGLLALAYGDPVRLDTFVDVLWRETPPVSAAGIVHTYISRLRRTLQPPADDTGGRRLVHDGTGYRMRVADNELDLLNFRSLVAAAHSASLAGDVDCACDTYERALILWRGEPVADIDALQGHPVVVALGNERAAVILDYADVAAASGWQERALPHLRGLAARRRLDELVHAQLMIGLASSGHQAEALQVFEDLRRRLDQELGVLPGAELREAHDKVLHQDVRRQPAYGPERERWLPLFQLPAAPADFTGRAAEVKRLVAAITPRPNQPGVPLSVVSGPPGVGKTALALYAAHTASSEFPDGQLWVHLAGVSANPRYPGDALSELLRSLGVPGSAIPRGLQERAACYRSRLAGLRILVVADDAATVDQLAPLMPGTPGCALLVTSRSHLDGLDGAQLMMLDIMTAEDAMSLLSQMAGRNRVAAEMDAANALIKTCGALPLAIRIIGARLAARPSWPLSLMARQLASANTRLRELESGSLSVRASIASSYAALSERARRAFRLLALLSPGDFPEWVISALLGEQQAPEVAGELEGRSMLTVAGADAVGEPCYRLHVLLWCFAAERLLAEESGTGPGQGQ